MTNYGLRILRLDFVVILIYLSITYAGLRAEKGHQLWLAQSSNR